MRLRGHNITTKLQIRSQVFRFFLNVISGKQISLQAQIAQKIKNSQCFLYITAGSRYHIIASE